MAVATVGLVQGEDETVVAQTEGDSNQATAVLSADADPVAEVSPDPLIDLPEAPVSAKSPLPTYKLRLGVSDPLRAERLILQPSREVRYSLVEPEGRMMGGFCISGLAGWDRLPFDVVVLFFDATPTVNLTVNTELNLDGMIGARFRF